MGAGLSITRFFKAVTLTLLSRRANPAPDPEVWASLVVIGAGLSITRFLRAVTETLLSRRANPAPDPEV